MRKSIALSVAIAMAIIFLAPSALIMGDDASEDSSAVSGHISDEMKEWIFDDFNYDDPKISIMFAVLTGIVMVLLVREIKKHGIYSETLQKKPVHDCCPQCGCELSPDYEFCPTCGFKPAKH